MPHVRARNLVLTDTDGTVLASAPKAGVTLQGASLFVGRVTVDSLELIGPRVNARRNLDGSVQLGIVAAAASADEVTVVNESDFRAPKPRQKRRAEIRHGTARPGQARAVRASLIFSGRAAKAVHSAISTTSRSPVPK